MRWFFSKKQSTKARESGYSLRRRLIATTLGSSIIVGIVSTTIVLVLAWKEVSDSFDDTLEEGARLVLALGEGISQHALTPRGRPADVDSALRLDYQIISEKGEVMHRGDDAPKYPFVDIRRKDDRFYDVWVGKKRWRVYIRHHNTQPFSVQIGQKWEDRADLIVDMLESLAWPLIGLWLLLGIVNWWIIRRLFAPLDRLAIGMEAKSPSDLTPMIYDGNAKEVRTVVSSLNKLLARLSKALENERRFTADAAHELRTPLAALMSRVQVLKRRLATSDNPAVLDDVQRLQEDIRRTVSLVDSLLQLARLDPEFSDMEVTQTITMRDLIDDVVRLCTPDAMARGVSIKVDCDVYQIKGNEQGLHTVLRNLISNAISYGRQNGQVEVWVGKQEKQLIITVKDDGDGVSEVDLERLSQRFFRVLGTGVPGSGLGLSIVARIVALHGGSVRFGSGLDGRGLGVTLLLPINS